MWAGLVPGDGAGEGGDSFQSPTNVATLGPEACGACGFPMGGGCWVQLRTSQHNMGGKSCWQSAAQSHPGIS